MPAVAQSSATPCGGALSKNIISVVTVATATTDVDIEVAVKDTSYFVTGMLITNTSATNTSVKVYDNGSASGTWLGQFDAPAGLPGGAILPAATPFVVTAGNKLTIKPTDAVSTLTITTIGCKRQ
jgi:hypothetical protein